MSIQLSGPGMSQPRFRQRNRGNSKTVRVNFKKHAPSNKALNNKIKAIQSKEELKHVDNYVVYGLSTSGTFSLLNAVATGDTEGDREGNDISATSIQYRISYITSPTANLIGSILVRGMILWDSQYNGSTPAAANVLDTSVITSPLMPHIIEIIKKDLKYYMIK